jgi:hypothetical protein
MFGNNPYAAGGWYNPQNPLSINGGGHPMFPNAAPPPTFGALPPASYTTSTLKFEFTPAQPDILNSTVNGPNGTTYLRIATQNGVTVITKPRNESLARIEWQATPIVEIRNVIPKANASQWLRLSQDQRSGLFYVYPLSILSPLLQLSNYDSLRQALCLGSPRRCDLCEFLQKGLHLTRC